MSVANEDMKPSELNVHGDRETDVVSAKSSGTRRPRTSKCRDVSDKNGGQPAPEQNETQRRHSENPVSSMNKVHKGKENL